MEGRKQFTFYRSYYEALSKLPRSKRLGALEAVIAYALDGIEPEKLDDVQMMAFVLIKPTLDAGRKKAEAGWVGGSKPKTKRKQTASKGEMEKENENELEIEIETEDECPEQPGFEEFWDLYPVKVGKDKARQVWKQLRPEGQAACDGVRKWLQTEQWRKDQGRFIPRAAKFLEERHYEALPAGHIPPGASGVLGKAELEAIARVMAEN